MDAGTAMRFLEQLRACTGAAAIGANDAATFRVPVERYTDAALCERERAVLFRHPRIVAASAGLHAGACVPVDGPGVGSAVVVRGADGCVRAFANVCRHRGTRLVDAPCSLKAFVCPYHAWTYDLTGKLVHVPHATTFPGVDVGVRDLVELPVAERHGLIWLGDDVDAYLGELAVDVAALRLDDHVLWRRSSVTRRCNWKLVVEAFLDGYHIRVLHRDSVYRYFVDGLVISERVGPHIRAMTARRKLREAPSELIGADVRQLATPSLLLFPATTVVEHPDFISIMTVMPLAPDLSQWDHMMLVPRERAGETELWDKAWTVIEEGVFQREDLWVCEQVQRGIATGAIDELLFGQLERAAEWFHEAVGAALDQPLHSNA